MAAGVVAVRVGIIAAGFRVAGILAAVLMTVLFLVLIHVPPTFWVAVGMLLIVGASSPVLNTENAKLSVAMRLVGLATILLAAFTSRASRREEMDPHARRLA